MTYLELVRRLKLESGRSGDLMGTLASLNLDDQRLAEWVADQWSIIERDPKRDWSWQRRSAPAFTLVIGKPDYLPADFSLTDFSAWWPEGRLYRPYVYRAGAPSATVRLRWVPLDFFKQQYQDQAQLAGVPQVWTQTATGQLLLGPTPSEAFLLKADWKGAVTRLADDADALPLPDDLALAVVWAALKQVAAFDAAPELLTRADFNLQQSMQLLIERYTEPPELGTGGFA